jgi:hypothetical protein
VQLDEINKMGDTKATKGWFFSWKIQEAKSPHYATKK